MLKAAVCLCETVDQQRFVGGDLFLFCIFWTNLHVYGDKISAFVFVAFMDILSYSNSSECEVLALIS